LILTSFSDPVDLFRAFDPRWAAEPLSGAGASRAGGRFNRRGQPALYLALELLTAVREYQQASPFLPPLTLVTYRAHLPPLVDLTRLTEGDWDPLWQDWECDWRHLLINERTEPPSWVLGDLVRECGCPGILFPSQANVGGTNLVLFMGLIPAREILQVLDPDRRLPTDGSSWAHKSSD